MIAGRSAWLCQGTTPPGLISSRRRRNKRSLTPTSVSSTSGIEATTSSVTSLGIVGPACWPEPSSLVLPGGHSAAPARPPKATSTTEPNPHDRQFPSAGLAVDHFHPLLFRRLRRRSPSPGSEAASDDEKGKISFRSCLHSYWL